MVIEASDPLAPTYQLNPDSQGARGFYGNVAALVDEVLASWEPLRDLTRRYRQFWTSHRSDPQAGHEETSLELLTLAVLWVARGREAILQSPSQSNLVTELVRERRNGCAKRRDASQNGLIDFGVPLDFGALQPSLPDLKRLSDWLLATGEYDDELARIEGWLEFFAQDSWIPQRDPLRLLVNLARDFADRAERKLGPYTQGVDRFLLEQLPRLRQREDAIQCSRRRIEYHLNLFAAELLNRVWRDEFLACKKWVVVLSGCLRRRDHTQCRAIRNETAIHCSHCTKDCAVSSATRLAQRYGATAVAVIHGSDFSHFLHTAQARGAGTGIIGVACAPGIMGAGLRAKVLGIPAQCVVLHSSGCGHWREKRSATSFDLSELERLLAGHNHARVSPYESPQAF